MSAAELHKVLERMKSGSDDPLVLEAREAALRLARVVELKDHPGSGHAVRVGNLSAMVAEALGMSAADVEVIRLAAQLHDIGKVGVPDQILFKDAPLTAEEMAVVKTHTTIGASLLSGSNSALFRMAEVIALYHHENWNGTGYTPGLEREGIPLVGRIVRVTDSFDAMTMSRSFTEQWGQDRALEFMRAQSGKQFEPRVVAALLEVVPEYSAE